MIKRITAAATSLFFLTAAAALISAPVSAQQQGLTVEGQVVNHSPQTPIPEGLVVTLHRDSGSQHDHLEATTDSEGRFLFENVVPDPFIIYGVSVRYQDALYGTDLDLLSGPPPSLLLEIFETSNDQEIIHANSASILFAKADKETRMVAVLEIVQLVNTSDFTYVAETNTPMGLLRFGLPPGAESLKVDTRLLGADVVQVDRGFAVLAAIPPGQHDIMYTYEFPYTSSVETFTKSLPFGAEEIRILSPDDAIVLYSDELGDPEMITIGDRPYQLIKQADLARGSEFTVTLSNLPRATFLDDLLYSARGIRPEFFAPAILAVFMAGLTAFAIRRRRRREALPVAVDAEQAATQQDRNTLLRLLYELEQNYENGDLPAESYHRRRRVLETRLASVRER